MKERQLKFSEVLGLLHIADSIEIEGVTAEFSVIDRAVLFFEWTDADGLTYHAQMGMKSPAFVCGFTGRVCFADAEGILTSVQLLCELDARMMVPKRTHMDEMQLVKVRYGTDSGLVSLKLGILLAASEENDLHVENEVPQITIGDRRMTEIAGEEHCWNDVIDMLQKEYNWETKSLP